MRKLLISALLFGIAGLIGYLAWTGTNAQAVAQVGVGSPAPAAPSLIAPPGITPVGSGQPAFTMETVRVLPAELAVVPEDPSVSGAPVSAAESKIEAELHSTTEMNFKDTPLRIVMEQLSARHKINIVLDLPALKEAGVEPDATVTKHLSGISLRSALHLLLDELQLKYAVHNEVLLITSPTKAESDDLMITKVYPVKDLVLVRNDQGGIGVDFQALTDLLTETIATKTWQDNGGPSTMSTIVVRGHCLLVVSQTQEVHEQIADILAALRKAGGGSPANELLLPTRATKVVPNPLNGMGWGVGGMGGGMGGGFF